jgi:hypothetical protein
MFDISFVTLSWNSDAYLQRCLASIMAQCATEGLRGEILVVDNGSQDGSVDTVRAFGDRFPGCVRLTTLAQNRGTTFARNLALTQAQSPVVCVIDSDTEFLSGSLRSIIKLLRDDEVGIVAPRLLLPDLTVQHSVKRFPTFIDKLRKVPRILTGRPVPRTDCYPSFPFEVRTPVESAISACWFFRKDLLGRVGFLDEAIFYAPEDVEYSMRVWRSGRQVVYDPSLVLLHHTQQISHRRPFSMLALSHLKGLLHYHRKHGGWLRRQELAVPAAARPYDTAQQSQRPGDGRCAWRLTGLDAKIRSVEVPQT